METFNYNCLINTLPIKKGAAIDIVSDLFNITKKCWSAGKKFDPNDLIDALCSAVGKDGTVLIRTFSWDFCHGKGFDAKRTLSQVGALGNVALKRSDFRRTKHPIYSWMVWGKYQDFLCSLEETDAFGMNSVFAWEDANPDALQINIGSPSTNGVTLFHYVEELVGVPYRYIKEFTDKYTDETGKESIRTYSMYVRNLNYEIVTKDAAYNSVLEDKGIKTNGIYEGIEISSYAISKLCRVYEDDFRKNEIPTGVTVTPVCK